MSIEYTSDGLDKLNQNVKDFIKNLKEEFKNNKIKSNNLEEYIKNNKKSLQSLLNQIFGIKNIGYTSLNEIYNKIGLYNLLNKGDLLDCDVHKIKKEVLKLQKNSQRLEKIYKTKLQETVSKIEQNIVDYLNDNLSDEEKKSIFKKIEPYTGKINSIKNVEIGQTLIQTMGRKHVLITLVVDVNGKKLNVDILKNKKTGKIVENFVTKATDDLHGGNKASGVRRKIYDNPSAGFILNPNYKLNKTKFNLIDDQKLYYDNNGKESLKINLNKDLREKVKNGEKDNELNEFIQIPKEWNKIFKKNKKELEQAKTEEEKKQIIDTNAQAIADLFADNASLQGTMDFDNSHGMEGVKGYFLHFLATLPTMKFSKINKIDLVEDSLLFVQGDYIFEVSDGNGGRIKKDANFAFYFEKNFKTGKWGIKRLKSTFGKTEDNLKEV